MLTARVPLAKGRALAALPGDLIARLRAHLRQVYDVHVVAACASQMHGSRAEINAESMMLVYDDALPAAQVAEILAHELGHLVLHQRLRDPAMANDPLLASAYGEAGLRATTRYSPRTYEEVQAAAFALELLTPSDVVWRAWRERAGATAASLAMELGCSAAHRRELLAMCRWC